jgi:Tol biopolymer transport system component
VYSEPSFSPDGERLAVLYGRPDDQVLHTWLVDLARSISTRFTFSGLDDQYPLWTRDGKRIVWGSDRQGGRDLYWKNADGSGTEELLVDMTTLFNDPSSVTSDAVVFRSLNRDTNEDVWVAPLGGGGKPRPLLNTTFNEVDAAVSPDERWMAYRSDESGRFEIYVVAFPSMEKKVRVSVDGAQPVLYTPLSGVAWRNDGRELYFVGGDGRSLMAVSVETGETFHAAVPHVVCQLPREVINVTTAPDGQTILVVMPASGNTRSVLNLFINWSTGFEHSR